MVQPIHGFAQLSAGVHNIRLYNTGRFAERSPTFDMARSQGEPFTATKLDVKWKLAECLVVA
jgi:hypothetical protein